MRLGNYAKTIEYQKQRLAIAREIRNRSGEGNALGNLGLAYQFLGNYAKAIEYQQQSLAIAREIKDRNGEGTALGNLGIAYYALGNYAKGIEYYEQQLAIAREIKDREGERIGLNNTGLTLQKQKQSDLAIVFYKQSVNVSESIRVDSSLTRDLQASYTQTVADTYRNLASLLLQQNRVMEALQVLDLLKVQELQDYLKDIKGNQLTAQGVPLLPQEREIVQAFNQNPAISQTASSQTVTALVGQLRQTAAAQNLTLPAYKDLQARIQKLGKNIALFYPLILSDRLELVLFIPDRPRFAKRSASNGLSLNGRLGRFVGRSLTSAPCPKFANLPNSFTLGSCSRSTQN